MRTIVVDTGVFVQALGRVSGFENFLDVLQEKYEDRIVCTTEIKKEYRGKVRISGLPFDIFARKVREELKKKNKIKMIGKSQLDKVDISSCKKLSDKYDVKIIKAAIAARAACIITLDHVLLGFDPYKCEKHLVRICLPEKYVNERRN
jgi:predicted nucleic acid-binding protein